MLSNRLQKRANLAIAYAGIFFLIVSLPECHGLVPLKNLILGDFSSQYIEDKSDPLDYVFRHSDRSKSSSDDSWAISLDSFRGFSWEGENLKSYCQKGPRVLYSSDWHRDQAKRAAMSTLQYIGLDISVRALASYARFFKFSDQEFLNLSQRLVGNYCSKNISVISLKEIESNLLAKFKKGSFFLPGERENPLLPSFKEVVDPLTAIREREFMFTIKLFRSFCSWNGLVRQVRLLAPLLKDPQIFAFIIRQMTKRKIVKSPSSKRLVRVYSPKSVQVSCENLVCRRGNEQKFKANVPRSLGSTSYSNDFKRLYCSDFAKTPLYPQDQNKRAQKWINDQGLDTHKLLITHFIALLTEIPNLFLWVGDYNRSKDFMRASVDQTWGDWAKMSIDNFSQDIFHEEALTIDLVDRRQYFDPFLPHFAVKFDVNMGEFDRLTDKEGKIKAQFSLRVNKKFLIYMRQAWGQVDPRKPKKWEVLRNTFRKTIEAQVEQAKKLFVLAPWTGQLEELIVDELITQLSAYKGNFFNKKTDEKIKIPISFNYGLFALKYMNYLFLTSKEIDAIAQKSYRKKIFKD